MKKQILSFTFVLVCLAQNAFALLPPLAQSIAELKAILHHEQLQHDLGMSNRIESITKTDHNYAIDTSSSQLIVDIVYKPMKHPGPAQFELKFNPVMKKENNETKTKSSDTKALPPLAQSISELNQLIDNEQFKRLLTMGEGIVEIKRVNDSYIIKTFHKELKADVIYTPSSPAGPVKVEFKFNQPTFSK